MGKKDLEHLLAVILVHVFPNSIGIELLELAEVLPRCSPRLDPIVVAYPVEEAHGDDTIDLLQGSSPVERLHEGLPAGVCQGCLPSSGFAPIEQSIDEAAIQLPLAQGSPRC